jgi:hypothetical protein
MTISVHFAVSILPFLSSLRSSPSFFEVLADMVAAWWLNGRDRRERERVGKQVGCPFAFQLLTAALGNVGTRGRCKSCRPSRSVESPHGVSVTFGYLTFKAELHGREGLCRTGSIYMSRWFERKQLDYEQVLMSGPLLHQSI